MKFQLCLLLTACWFVRATPTDNDSSFIRFSLENLHKLQKETSICQNPDFYIKAADIEESDPANRDKIILYHGETYGVWIFQMIMKSLLYPEAPEDWLPLRFEALNRDIDKLDLLRLLEPNVNDHNAEYRKLGMSVSPNLLSNVVKESAWGTICHLRINTWHKISGFSDRETMHHSLYGLLRKKFIPRTQWSLFKKRKKLLNYFIQEKRNLYQTNVIKDYFKKIENLFPNTFRDYAEVFKSMTVQKEKKIRNDFNSEGVALQIIMDKDLADQITYDAVPFGYYKDELSKNNLFQVDKIWEKHDVQPYSEIYRQVKNRKDDEQARLALTNDFRQYPSRVRIKAIAGIMENPTDYEIVKSMIKEMVGIRKSKSENQEKILMYEKFKNKLNNFF